MTLVSSVAAPRTGALRWVVVDALQFTQSAIARLTTVNFLRELLAATAVQSSPTTPETQPHGMPSAPRLRRALGLPALVVYGIILIQPTAPMPLFGVAHQAGNGHVVTLILMGMVAMLFTALSYGRMANA